MTAAYHIVVVMIHIESHGGALSCGGVSHILRHSGGVSLQRWRIDSVWGALRFDVANVHGGMLLRTHSRPLGFSVETERAPVLCFLSRIGDTLVFIVPNFSCSQMGEISSRLTPFFVIYYQTAEM